jgi:hypothetical protein
MAYTQEYLDMLFEADQDIKQEEILNLEGLQAGSPTSNYVNFILGNVVSATNPFRIQPFELFLIMNDTVNAWAWHNEGKNIIAIYLKLYKVLENMLRTNFPKLNGPGSALMKKLTPALKREDGQLPEDFLLYQYATLFVYFHELAHLHQQSHMAGGGAAPLVSQERYHLGNQEPFDQEAHAMEIDADICAANIMSEYILQFWESFPAEHRTPDVFATLISMACASIFVFFYVVSGGWQDIYFMESDHPHPIIRISYVANALAANGVVNMGINDATCLHNGLEIAREVLIAGGEQGIEEYIQLYSNNTAEIGNYITQEMAPYMQTLPFLIQNRQW